MKKVLVLSSMIFAAILFVCPVAAQGQAQSIRSDSILVNLLEASQTKGFAARCTALESHQAASMPIAFRRLLASKLGLVEVGLGQCLMGRPKLARSLNRNERILRPLESVAAAGAAFGVIFMIPNLLSSIAGEKPNKLTMGVLAGSLVMMSGVEALRASNKAYAMFDLRAGKRTKLSLVSFNALKKPGLKLALAF